MDSACGAGANTPMTSIVKLQKKGKLTIPNRLRKHIGLAEGDYIQVASRGDKIILELAKVVTHTAAKELTPAQKRKLDERFERVVKERKRSKITKRVAR